MSTQPTSRNNSRSLRRSLRATSGEREDNAVPVAQSQPNPGTGLRVNSRPSHRSLRRDTNASGGEVDSTVSVAQTQPDPGTEDSVCKLLQQILTRYNNKIPVRRPDMIKNCCDGDSKKFDETFKMACDKLYGIYGIKMIPVDADISKSIKKYIFVPEQRYNRRNMISPNQLKGKRLLFLVMLYLAGREGKATETSLFRFLENAKIGHVDSSELELFITQLYIRKDIIEYDERYDYSYSQRGFLEFPIDKMKTYALKLSKDYKPRKRYINNNVESEGEQNVQDADEEMEVDSDD